MSWHAQRYSLKAYTIIRTTPNVVQWVEGESFVPKVVQSVDKQPF